MTTVALGLPELRVVARWTALASMLALGACSGSGDDEGPEGPLGEAGAGSGGRGGGGSGGGGGGSTAAGTGANSTGNAGTASNSAGSGGNGGNGVAGVDSGMGESCLPPSACDDAGTGSDAGSGGSGEPSDDAICTSDGACEEVVQLQPAQHMEGDIDYGELPPAGGPHNPCWADYGVHDELLPPENWVHNLEHGGVVYLYDCPAGCDAEVTMLEALVSERPKAILTRFEGLTTRFAVVAWGYRLMTDELDLDAFAAFYDAHSDHGPESVPSGKPSGCP